MGYILAAMVRSVFVRQQGRLFVSIKNGCERTPNQCGAHKEVTMEAMVQGESSSPGKEYHRVAVTRHGGPDVLQVVEADLPERRSASFQVKVLAAGLSA